MLTFCAAGCNSRGTASTDMGLFSSGTGEENTRNQTPAHQSELDASSLLSGNPPLPVSTESFISNPQWPECIHPGVVERCSDGWCNIPAGCFIFGTAEGTPWRAAVGEEQGPVT